MKIFADKTNIDFLGKGKLALGFSFLLILISIASLYTKGLNLGVDFTGGYLIEAGYSQPVELEPVREALVKSDYADALVQHFGTSKSILVRIAPREGVNSASISDDVLKLLKSISTDTVEMRRIEFVGPQVGEELREQGGLALLIAIFGIMIYVALRFQIKSAFGAILALVHDVVITVGVFSITQIQFDLTVLAAILAVIGYSLNDTVVVLDRIRETFRAQRKGTAAEILNMSINDTLSRTTITSGTTLIVVLALFFLGGEVIHGFAFALIVGIFIGTYSSIYIAGNSLMMMGVSKVDFLEHVKETEEVDDLP